MPLTLPPRSDRRVLAYDPDQLQFVADIRTTPRDPGAIYALSSRFHRYFLKNLNPNEVNVRIIRLDDASREDAAARQHIASTNSLLSSASSTNYEPAAINFKHQHQFTLGSPSPPPPPSTPSFYTSSAVPFFSQPGRPSLSQSTPYRFEQVGVINKAVQNPFIALNTGERPQVGGGGNKLRRAKQHQQHGSIVEFGPPPPSSEAHYYQQHYRQEQHPVTSSYHHQQLQHDFNGLRVAKNAAAAAAAERE